MKKCLLVFTFAMPACCLFFSCGNVGSEVDSRLEKLLNKTETLDSLINKEVNKVLTLDSLIDKEHEKVKKLDTLINRSSSQFDSLTKQGGKLIEKIGN
jgi:hypothetical protein